MSESAETLTGAQAEVERASKAGDQPEAPTPTKSHVAMAQGDDSEGPPLVDQGQYYIGLWSGIPNYGCPFCGYAVLGQGDLDGNGAVEMHVLERIEQGNQRHMAALDLKGEGGLA